MRISPIAPIVHLLGRPKHEPDVQPASKEFHPLVVALDAIMAHEVVRQGFIYDEMEESYIINGMFDCLREKGIPARLFEVSICNVPLKELEKTPNLIMKEGVSFKREDYIELNDVFFGVGHDADHKIPYERGAVSRHGVKAIVERAVARKHQEAGKPNAIWDTKIEELDRPAFIHSKTRALIAEVAAPQLSALQALFLNHQTDPAYGSPFRGPRL